MSLLDKYRKDDHLIGPDECYYESDDYEGLIQVGLLGFCGCGDPDGNLLYVLRGLQLLHERYTTENVTLESSTDNMLRQHLHHGNEQSTRFFHYWLDKEELTEHGSVLPGWLTPKGEELLGLLQEWYISTSNS